MLQLQKNLINNLKVLPIKLVKAPNTLMHEMLVTYRDYVIYIVKKPLMDMIILTGKRFQKKFKVTRDNLRYDNSFVLLDFWDLFFQYDKTEARKNMFEALRDISVSENEHDFHYAFRFQFLIEFIIKAILDGKWLPRPENTPYPKYWGEPSPYGGEHTIIYKMRKHREEIKKIIGV